MARRTASAGHGIGSSHGAATHAAENGLGYLTSLAGPLAAIRPSGDPRHDGAKTVSAGQGIGQSYFDGPN